MREFLHHLFVPRESNNHRAKLLHHQSILFVIISLFVVQFFMSFVQTHLPEVLGIRIDISTQELLLFTNQKRQEKGLVPLVFNEQLSNAAYLKAKDMFAKNYWAHTSPDGVTPWYYFKTEGYDYEFAGENLARGFTESSAIVEAWMISPTHRENMLSSNYQEVGFAVVEGKLAGEDTVLIVEMLGGKEKQLLVAKNGKGSTTSAQTATSPLASRVASITSISFFDSSGLSKSISFIVLSLFLLALLLDVIIVEKKKIVRFVGHNIDHIAFFGALLLCILIVSKGIVL